MEVTQKTESGHFYKLIPRFGILLYSPYTGLTYAICEQYSKQTIEWLNGGNHILPESLTTPLKINAVIVMLQI